MRTDGDCLEVAANFVLDNYDEDYILVHGAPTGTKDDAEGLLYVHAWVEVFKDGIWWVIEKSNGNDMTLPACLYYGVGSIDPERTVRYTREEARRALLDHEEYGPWDEGLLAIHPEGEKVS